MQEESTIRECIPAMLEVPRGLVLQQGLPGAALEGEGGRAQAVLHQMGIVESNEETIEQRKVSKCNIANVLVRFLAISYPI